MPAIFLMGTLFQSLEVKTGFQLRLMKTMGYDVHGLGNHEYDFGPEWLAAVISTSAFKWRNSFITYGNAMFDKKIKGTMLLKNFYPKI